MINPQDIENLALPGLHPEQKFFMIERLANDRLDAEPKFANEPAYGIHEYMVSVLAAAQEYGIDELSGYELPCKEDEDEDWQAKCRKFQAQAGRVSQRLMFRYTGQSNAVALDLTTKEKISHWITQIRDAVEKSDISAAKKDRLFDLINKMQAEVDRERTPVHAAGELWMTFCTYLAEGSEKLGPVVKLVERIGGALGLAQIQDAEQPRIPQRQEPKKLEPPPKNSNGPDRLIDDGIPF